MQESESFIRNKSPAVGQVRGLGNNSPSPSKKKLRKLRDTSTTIKWGTEAIMIPLFKSVLAKQPHIKTNNIEKNAAWTEVKEMFFQQDIMLQHFDQEYSETIDRNMRVAIVYSFFYLIMYNVFI